MHHVLRSVLGLAVGLLIGVAAVSSAFASPGDIAAAAHGNAADLYASVAANAAELRATIGP